MAKMQNHQFYPVPTIWCPNNLERYISSWLWSDRVFTSMIPAI